MNKKGLLLVVSGPSGVGKGTVCNRLIKANPNIVTSVSVTTRAPRPGEVDGVSYFFRSGEEFERMIQAGEFLEYTYVFGRNHYGTPRAYVEQQRLEGKDVILEIDVQGGFKVKEQCPEAVMIFIAPPSMDTLRSRLEGRGTESREAVERRFEVARAELAKAKEYEYIIINDRLEEAVKAAEGIILAERHRSSRNACMIDEL